MCDTNVASRSIRYVHSPTHTPLSSPPPAMVAPALPHSPPRRRPSRATPTTICTTTRVRSARADRSSSAAPFSSSTYALQPSIRRPFASPVYHRRRDIPTHPTPCLRTLGPTRAAPPACAALDTAVAHRRRHPARCWTPAPIVHPEYYGQYLPRPQHSPQPFLVARAPLSWRLHAPRASSANNHPHRSTRALYASSTPHTALPACPSPATASPHRAYGVCGLPKRWDDPPRYHTPPRHVVHHPSSAHHCGSCLSSPLDVFSPSLPSPHAATICMNAGSRAYGSVFGDAHPPLVPMSTGDYCRIA
ncbi:hypothetical protein DFH09DRAFT_1192554 [Mycena vulgaris]|nr:hypothetical protein DFH09DRAFT_1192554 [Mycena vulgaris]